MNMPKITKRDKHHAEKVLRQKVDEMADNAKTKEEIREAQTFAKEQVQIESGVKPTIFGLPLMETLSLTATVAVPVVLANIEQVKVLTGKAWNMVPKVRLR